MKSMMEQLYMGNVGFDSARYPQGSPFVKAAEWKLENMEKLTQTLSDYQRKLFENYCDAQGDTEAITRYDMFVSSLRFGALLMMEILDDSGNS